MAIFGKKTKKEVKEKAPVVVSSAAKIPVSHAGVLIKPRVTEKAGIQSEKNIYTFEVSKKATKITVAQAIKEAYKVTPIKVNIVNLPAKQFLVRGKRASQTGVKKALVFLKEGDKIEFV